MNIHLVTAEYHEQVNAVAEFRQGTVHTIEEAENWLKNETVPAYMYIDGTQNLYAFLTLCCAHNTQYWEEYKKVID